MPASLPMPRNARAIDLPTDPNSLEARLIEAVRQALVRAGLSQKAAAITMGIDEGDFSRRLAQGRFDLPRSGRLGKPFGTELKRQLDTIFPDDEDASIRVAGRLAADAIEFLQLKARLK